MPQRMNRTTESPCGTGHGAGRGRRALPLLCALPLVAACAPTIDLKRLAYETLRREDCRRNEPEGGFCERGFAHEYLEYERLRRDFMREHGPSADGVEG